ncbi:MAG: dihydroorotate dehydrogenase [bacterium]|nr:dihydroorotate dehydrogenase [bacterium]
MITPKLTVNISGIKMRNPVMVASGTFGYGEGYENLVPLDKLGAIVTKGITMDERSGNPSPRICETPSGMLNAIGLQNVGLKNFINERLPYLRQFDVPVIVNICGESVDEYVELSKRLSEVSGIAGLEVNISCPNVQRGGMIFGKDPDLTYEVVSKVRKSTHLPLIVKLTPNVGDITCIANSARLAGCDAISLINTLTAMAIDIHTRKPKLATITGGLSGPAIKPVAIRMVWEVAKAINLPIIGQGGIMDAQDALEFIIVGASAVSVGTGNFVNPMATLEIIDGIRRYMIEHRIDEIDQLIGSVKV